MALRYQLTEEKIYSDQKISLESLKTAILVGGYTRPKELDLCKEHLDELEALAGTYGFETVEKIPCHMRKFDAGTYLGQGKIEEIATHVGDVVIFDDEITPNQQKNLEQMLGRPVIDRTELILEIFSQRAHTKEARLQIELAKIRYQLPRLKRLWTHLSRQTAGGGGFTKGEGERQIELDRRILKRRISRLNQEISEVRKNREVQRQKRLRSGVPTFAIIGYTNAGKSTLLNELTQAGVLSEDKLFATLDTTTRKFILPNHQEILLIDTVGFIRKIPTTLVAAFRSTLEEAVYTDILLHIVDVSHPLVEEHADTTYEVLKELNISGHPVITVLNKVDQLENKLVLHKLRVKYPRTVAISATNREGFPDLLHLMEEELRKLRKVVHLRVPQSSYELVSELMTQGRVITIDYEGNDVLIEAEIPTILEHKVQTYVVD